MHGPNGGVADTLDSIAASRLDAAFSQERHFRRGASARRRASALFPIVASFGVRSRARRGGEAGMVGAA